MPFELDTTVVVLFAAGVPFIAPRPRILRTFGLWSSTSSGASCAS